MSRRQQYEPKQTTLPFVKAETKRKICECGCGLEVKPRRRFMQGHNGKKDFLPFEEARKVVRFTRY